MKISQWPYYGKIDEPDFTYLKDNQTCEIEVDADGKVIEPLKWDISGSKEKDKQERRVEFPHFLRSHFVFYVIPGK